MKPLQPQRFSVFRCPPLWVMAVFASLVMLAAGLGFSLPTLPASAGTSTSAPWSTSWPGGTSGSHSGVWSAFSTEVLVRERNGATSPEEHVLATRYWGDPRRPSYIHSVRDIPDFIFPDEYYRLPPASLGDPRRPNIVPQYLRSVLPADPVLAVVVLRDQQCGRPVQRPEAISRSWECTVSILTKAMKRGPVWQGEDARRWWELFQMIPGVERGAAVDDGRGGRGYTWVWRNGRTSLSAVMAHDSTEVAQVEFRTPQGQGGVILRETVYFNQPYRIPEVPEDVVAKAKPLG